MKLKWIESAGGPLILMPEELLQAWDGGKPPSDGRIIEAKFRAQPGEPATDYDRACDINDYQGVIKVGAGDALVIAGSPDSTTWLPDPNHSAEAGFLIRWICADSEEEMVRHFPMIPRNIFDQSGLKFSAGSGKLVLFDSVTPGNEAMADEKNFLRFRLSPGLLRVTVAEYAPNPRTEMLIHFFRRA